MSMDTEIDDLELDDPILDDQDDGGDDEPVKGRSVRESLEKAWEKHGGDLPEERKSARDERRAAKPNAKPDNKDLSREAPRQAAPAKQDAAPAAEPKDAPAPSVAPPNGWSQEAKTAWAKLPPAVQAAVTKRENDMTAGARQLQQRYGGIHQLTQRLAPRFQRLGVTPDQGFANVASWFEAIENNPAEGIRALAQQYNVDASKLGAAASAPAPNGASNGATPRPPADPRIDQLMRWAGEMQQTRSNEVQLAKLAAWSPQRPHFDNVRSLMGDLLETAVKNQDPRFLNAAGTDIDLDKLYEAACQVHPDVGLQILEEKAKAERDKRQQNLLQKRNAGTSMRTGTPGSAPLKGEQAKKLPKGSPVRAHVQAAWDELRSS